MSNNIVLDYGIDVGSDKTENTYFKLKMGRGKQEVATLRQEIEAGTGKPMVADKHCVCLRFGDNAETDMLTEMVEGMCPGEGAITKEGPWLLCSLADAAGDGDEGDMFKDIEGKVNEFFNEVESNAYVEFVFSSAFTFDKALEVATANNENGDGKTEEYPSFLRFLESVNCSLRMDIDHDFLASVMKFGQKMGAPSLGENAEFFRKLNQVQFRVNVDGLEALTEETATNMKSMAWEALTENLDMFAELSAFKSLTNEMKLVFLLKDDTYLQLEVKMPGMEKYIEYFAQEE